MKRFICALLLVVCACASAQLHHDPLTSIEVDQMRDTAQDPERRIDLLLGFARTRLLGVAGLHIDTKSGRPGLAKAEELLGDFALIIDELDDNLDMYDTRGEDLRTSLRHVLDAESGLQQQLKGLADQLAQVQAQGSQGSTAVGLTAALADATDSLQSSNESAGSMLAAQERKRGEAGSEKKSGPPQ